jgi:ketosteroid isomerase-like protein
MLLSPRRPPLSATAARPALRLTALVALFCCAGLAACRGRSDATEPVRALVAREVAAINAGDLKGLSQVWAKDDEALLFDVPDPGRFRGWKTIEPVWKSFFEQFSDIHMGVGNLDVRVSGDLAYATYDWNLSGRVGDYALDDRGAATEVFRRGADGWKVVHLHYSARAPKGAEPAPAGPAKTPDKGPKTPASH